MRKRIAQLQGWAPVLVVVVVTSLAMASVSIAADQSTSKGRIPDEAFLADGSIVDELVPDFVAVWGHGGEAIAGYTPKEYVLSIETSSDAAAKPVDAPAPVFGEDLETLVGHMVPGLGFVPIGDDAGDYPELDVEVGPAD